MLTRKFVEIILVFCFIQLAYNLCGIRFGQPCSPGFYREYFDDFWPCKKCSKRRFNVDGVFYCDWCPNGKISTANRTACKDCPVGTITSDDGCINCSPGSIEINRSCKKCPIGTYKKNETFCEKCPVGTYGKREGVSECTECIWEQNTNKNKNSSCDCPVGTFRLNATTCQKCYGGDYADLEGLLECKWCGTTHISTPNRTSCEKCAPGHHSKNNICTPCPNSEVIQYKWGNYRCRMCTFSGCITSSWTLLTG